MVIESYIMLASGVNVNKKKYWLILMGNIFSNSLRYGTDYVDLQNRIYCLEEAADLNKDGKITVDEIKEYAAQEIQLLRAEKIHLEHEIVHVKQSKQKKLDAACKEIQQWKNAYEELLTKHDAFVETTKSNQSPDCTAVISNKAIDKFVKELLNDPNINIHLLPDSIEKPIYVNTLKILLGIMQKTFNHTNLDIIGHEFSVRMKPPTEDI